MPFTLAARNIATPDGSSPFWVEGQSMPVAWIVGMVGLIAMVFLSWRGILMFRRLDERTESFRQFAGLARRAGLSVPEILALKRIAQLEKLTTPLTLLVCPATLSHHLDSATKKVSGRKARPLRRHAARVMDRLDN